MNFGKTHIFACLSFPKPSSCLPSPYHAGSELPNTACPVPNASTSPHPGSLLLTPAVGWYLLQLCRSCRENTPWAAHTEPRATAVLRLPWAVCAAGATFIFFLLKYFILVKGI